MTSATQYAAPLPHEPDPSAPRPADGVSTGPCRHCRRMLGFSVRRDEECPVRLRAALAQCAADLARARGERDGPPHTCGWCRHFGTAMDPCADDEMTPCRFTCAAGPVAAEWFAVFLDAETGILNCAAEGCPGWAGKVRA